MALQFRIVPAPTFTAAIALTVPGETELASVEFTFKHQGRQALAAWRAQVQPPIGAEALATWQPPTDADFLGAVIVNWSGPQDPVGQPAPYSPAALAELLDAYPASSAEIYAGYLKALTESRAKN